MKKQIIKKELKEVEIVEKTEYFCDKCNNEIRQSITQKDKNNIIIKRGKECKYDGGGYVEIHQAYFCNECSYTIKEALENIGVKFEYIEYDY